MITPSGIQVSVLAKRVLSVAFLLAVAACGSSPMEADGDADPCRAVSVPSSAASGYQLVGANMHPDATLSGSVTRWDSFDRIIVLGPEPGGDFEAEAGMNIVLEEPRVVNGSCVAEVTDANLVQADQRVGTGDQINARFYAFAPEAGFCRADRVGIVYITDEIIGVNDVCVGLQRVLPESPFLGDVITVQGVFIAGTPPTP